MIIHVDVAEDDVKADDVEDDEVKEDDDDVEDDSVAFSTIAVVRANGQMNGSWPIYLDDGNLDAPNYGLERRLVLV